jgi:mannosyltransferase OCH1-like enzyme
MIYCLIIRLSDPIVTEMLRDYGFIEQVPQRWWYKNNKIYVRRAIQHFIFSDILVQYHSNFLVLFF